MHQTFITLKYKQIAQVNLDKKFSKGFSKKLANVFLIFHKKLSHKKKIIELFSAYKFINSKNENYNKVRKLGEIK